MLAVYTCPFEITNFTAAIDLMEITPADELPCLITSMIIKQTSEIGEAQEEWLEVNVVRGGTAITSGSGGTTAANGFSTSAKLPPSGFTFEAGNTTIATFTGGTTPYIDAFQVRVGAEIRLTPEEYIGCSQANGGMVVRLPNAPTDGIDVKGTIFVGEYL
jgi:hypothetical protein